MNFDKPMSCPFCGHEPHIKSSGSFDGWNATIQCSNTKCHVYPSVGDEGKGLERTVNNAVRLWNRRNPDRKNNILDALYHLEEAKSHLSSFEKRIGDNYETNTKPINDIIKEIKNLKSFKKEFDGHDH